MITVPSWGTITLIEATWLLSGLLALLFCAAHLPHLIKDYTASVRTGSASLRVVAWSYVRRELIRMLQGALIMSVGIYAATQPSVSAGVSIVGLILTSVLLSLNFTVALTCWWDFKTRNEVKRLLEEEQ